MLLTFISGQVAAPLVAGKGTATYKELTLIGGLAIDEQLIVVKADSPFKSIEDVVAAANRASGRSPSVGPPPGRKTRCAIASSSAPRG